MAAIRQSKGDGVILLQREYKQDPVFPALSTTSSSTVGAQQEAL